MTKLHVLFIVIWVVFLFSCGNNRPPRMYNNHNTTNNTFFAVDDSSNRNYSCIAQHTFANNQTKESYWSQKRLGDSLQVLQYPQFLAHETSGMYQVIDHFVEKGVYVVIIEDSTSDTKISQIVSLFDFQKNEEEDPLVNGRYYYFQLIPYYVLNTAPNFDRTNDIIIGDRLIFMSQLGSNIFLSPNISKGYYCKQTDE